MAKIVTLVARSNNEQLPAAHCFYSFQIYCLPEFFFWAEQGFLIQVSHLSRNRDVQLVTGSLEHFRKVCSGEHTLSDEEANELLQVQLATIKSMINGPSTLRFNFTR